MITLEDIKAAGGNEYKGSVCFPTIEALNAAIAHAIGRTGVPLQKQICVNGEWKDAHETDAVEFPPDQVRFAFPLRPQMPKPRNTFADHSYPAFNREQMVTYSNDTAKIYAFLLDKK